MENIWLSPPSPVFSREIYFWTFVYQADFYLFKVNNGNTKRMYEIYSKLTVKSQERHHWRCSGVFITN